MPTPKCLEVYIPRFSALKLLRALGTRSPRNLAS